VLRALLALPILLAACAAPEPGEPAAPETPPPAMDTMPAKLEPDPCPDPPPCGDDCSNVPFVRNDCWTTPYGPARADVVVIAAADATGTDAAPGGPLAGKLSTNMLFCEQGAYALCFFSGPPDPTGKDPAGNAALPCVLDGDAADCTCQVYTAGPSFVDLNGILNQGAYYQTVQACQQDGSGCRNMVTCGLDGKKPGCGDLPEAPVCGYVAAQDPADPAVSLMPGADLVSTWSGAMDDDYQLGQVPCEGLYAGCMTAPCTFPEGAAQPPQDGDPIQCQCPTYKGMFQVGQAGQQCEIPHGTDAQGNTVRYVWSASYTVTAGS
jgi:hypothetical protein